MPRGVKSDMTPGEKYILHLDKTKEYKKNRILNDPEFAQSVRDYARNYARKQRELAKTEIALKKLQLEEKKE
jgi:hypothetical protein